MQCYQEGKSNWRIRWKWIYFNFNLKRKDKNDNFYDLTDQESSEVKTEGKDSNQTILSTTTETPIIPAALVDMEAENFTETSSTTGNTIVEISTTEMPLKNNSSLTNTTNAMKSKGST